MKKKIPLHVVLTTILEKRMNAEIELLHALLNVALPLLIADLHRRGVVDALALADRLAAQTAEPALLAALPQIAVSGDLLAARIREEALGSTAHESAEAHPAS